MTCAKLRRVMSTVIETLPFDIPVPDIDSCTCSSPLPETPRAFRRGDVEKVQVRYPFPVMSNEGNIPHITVQTVAKFLRGEFKKNFSKVLVVDCRFGYEYEGGHIKGAINMNDARQLKNLFETVSGSAAIIFHCEFSQSRGPTIASLFRNLDRKRNEDHYPNLNFPHVFVMYKGYKEFQRHFPGHCTGHYVKMIDSKARESGSLGREQLLFKENVEQARIEFGLEATEKEEEMKHVSIEQISPVICRRRNSRLGILSSL